MANVRKQEQEKGKVERVPFGGTRYKLQLSDADNEGFKRRRMVPRWFNDQDGRIQRALSGGYKFVKPEYATSLGSGAIHEGSTDPGSRVSKIVSKGEPVIRAYLMEISKKFWTEDQATKQKVVDKIDEDIARGQIAGAEVENQYGTGVTYSH